MVPFFRTLYNYDRYASSVASGFESKEVSRTVQSEKDDCDINTIVKRFGYTGQLPSGVRMPTYGDFTGVSDYQTALNALIDAQKSFDAMPADVRARFNNDPARFVDFCSDPKNLEEARRLGLAPASASAMSGDPAPASQQGGPEGGGAAQGDGA